MDLIRGIHADTMAAIVAGGFHPMLLVYLDWPGGAVRVHTGVGGLSWGGHTWLGTAGFGNVEIPGETSGPVPERAALTMVLAEEDFDATMGADIRGLDGVIYLTLTTERQGAVLIGEPFEIFSGYMDGKSETARREGAKLVNVIKVELGGGPGMRSVGTILHSDEDQRAAYPDDTIGRLLINSPDRQRRIIW